MYVLQRDVSTHLKRSTLSVFFVLDFQFSWSHYAFALTRTRIHNNESAKLIWFHAQGAFLHIHMQLMLKFYKNSMNLIFFSSWKD